MFAIRLLFTSLFPAEQIGNRWFAQKQADQAAEARMFLDELADRNGQTLFKICSGLLTRHQLRSSRQAISQHLEVLEEADLVETRRGGWYKFQH